jgi:His/Glu/Gln/Arg/opine family amino acid ABC transporter permease subunit
MATVSDPRESAVFGEAPTIVNYDEPPFKAPPVLVVGPLAWMRKNLFSTPIDALVTIGGALLILSLIVSFIVWVVEQANWFVILFNMRNFLMGSFQADAEWRLGVMVLLIGGVVGVVLGAFSRLPRIVPIVLIGLLALSILIPLAAAPLSFPPSYLAAGDAPIVVGTSTQPPVPQWGFIGQGGEVVRMRLANELSASDEALRTLAGFGDTGGNLLRAAAESRLTNNVRIIEIDRLLAADTPAARTLTASQRALLEAERARLSVTDPVVERLALNANPVPWRIWRGTTGETVSEGVLQPGEIVFTEVRLPENGWYVLERGGEGTALIEAYGMYPHLERNFIRSEVRDESGAIVQTAGRFSQYVRMTDTWTLEEPRPQIGRTNIPMASIIDLQYRGQRTFQDWLKVYFAPFMAMMAVPLLLLIVVGTAGYFAAKGIDRLPAGTSTAVKRNPRVRSQRLAIWLMIATPAFMFLLAYGGLGLPLTDTRRWGGLLLTIMLSMVGIIASFPLGVLLALGRRSSLPVVSTACTLYIEFVRGVPLITVLFMAQLLVPLVNPALAEVDNVFRAMVGITLFSAAYLAENVRGGLQAIPPGQEEAAKALGLAGWQVTLFITLPQALRMVIPALVGQFISLFKDTSLVAIVGLTDLTGIAQSSVAQTEFLGARREVYLFITIVYFVFCYVMAAISRRLEASGSGSARRV